MKRYLKTAVIATTAFMLAIIGAGNIYAEGMVSISADKESCANGDKVSITIEAKTDEGQAQPPQLTVEYNPNRLSFDNCSVEYGGGGGGLITINDTQAVIDFTTVSGGEATVKVTAVLNDDSTDVQIAEVFVNVDGEDTAVGTDDGEESDTGIDEGTISTGNGRVVQMVFANEFMPVLFHKETTSYQGQDVECAQFDMADMTLLYTTDEAGNDGKFCIYNVNSELSDFRMIQGIENRFIIILSEEAPEVPLGYTKAVLDWNGQTLTAYMDMDVANGNTSSFGGVSASDFFLIYGLSSEGNKGWYQYDQSEGTYQRYLQPAANQMMSDAQGTDADAKDSDDTSFLDGVISHKLQTILLLVFAAIALILIIVVIILAIKCAEYNDYEYVDPEDYYQNNNSAPNNRNVKVTAAAMAKRDMGVDEAEDEAEEVQESDTATEEDEDIEDAQLFDPRYSRRDEKAREKQLRREEKEAMREEKWRMKEEKKAAKMRARGYEEAMPMDWSTFGEEGEESEVRRPMGKATRPEYMQDDADENSAENAEVTELIEEDDIPGKAPEKVEAKQSKEVTARNERASVSEEEDAVPPRRVNPAYSAEREAESARVKKEEEMRLKQKRLFEQQQRIEEQRRIEQEQYEQQQSKAQEQYVLRQQEVDEDLDEDFQFEFLNL